MSQPIGTYDPVRRALAHLLETLADHRARGLRPDRERLLDDACMRFNLSPNDSEALGRLIRESEAGGNIRRES